MTKFEIILLIGGKVIRRCNDVKEAEKFIENHETPELIEVDFDENYLLRKKQNENK